jgi:hypothetical protein
LEMEVGALSLRLADLEREVMAGHDQVNTSSAA